MLREAPIFFRESEDGKLSLNPVETMQDGEPRSPSGIGVLVFSTSVATPGEIKILTLWLDSLVGRGKWNFALDDCDRILRIVSDELHPSRVIQLLRYHGFECNELED